MGKEFKPDAAIINQVVKTGVKPLFSLSFEVDGKYSREVVDRVSLRVVYESGGGDSVRIEDINGGCFVELGSNTSEMNLNEMKSKFLKGLEEEYHSMAGV